MELIIETLGTTHNILDRGKFRGPRVRIGRAFDNDLILTDEHIDPYHASISEDQDGRLWITDQDSTNGTRKMKQRGHRSRWPVQSGDIFQLGRNKIRIYRADHHLPPAVKIRPLESFLLWLGQVPVLLVLLVAYLLTSLLGVWLQQTGDWQWAKVLDAQLRTVLIFTVLAVLVYLLSILFRRGGNFLSHLGVLMLVFFLATFLAVVIELAYFNGGSGLDRVTGVLDAGSRHLLFFVYLWCILYLAFHMPMVRRTVIALGVVGLLAGFDILGSAQWNGTRNRGIETDNTHLPPALLWRDPSAEQPFFERAFQEFDRAGRKREIMLEERGMDASALAEVQSY